MLTNANRVFLVLPRLYALYPTLPLSLFHRMSISCFPLRRFLLFNCVVIGTMLFQVEIVMGLEEEFGITVEEDNAQNIATVQDAAELIDDLCNKKAA